jgi:hypothetical protein
MKTRATLALIALAIPLVACEATPGASATPSLDQRERTWLSQNITSYRTEVLVVRSVWHTHVLP